MSKKRKLYKEEVAKLLTRYEHHQWSDLNLGLCGHVYDLLEFDTANRVIDAMKSYLIHIVPDFKGADLNFKYWFPYITKTKYFTPVSPMNAYNSRLEFLRGYLEWDGNTDEDTSGESS